MKKQRDPLNDSMGLKIPNPINYEQIARTLRQADHGIFGHQNALGWNKRIPGTSATERVVHPD